MIIGRRRTPKLLQLSFLIFVLSIAIIGRRGSKAPIPLAHRPVMRSQDPEPATNLVSKPDVMGKYASAESVQALQAAIKAMQTEQGEIRQMLAGKGPATDDFGSQHGSRPPAEEAQATGPSDVPAATAPKFTRLEFPRFDGPQNTPTREFVSLAALHLIGVAQTWHLRLELEDPAISWQHFNQRCYLRFGPGLRGNALGMLTSVRQNGRPVEEYTDEFQEILGLTTTVRQDQEVDLYTAGLDEWLRIDVENLHPLNLDVAMNIARSSSRKQRWFSHPYVADPSFFPVPFAGTHGTAAQAPVRSPHYVGYDADPVAVRPYRYPQAQKDEIKRQSPVSPFLDSLRGDLAASDTACTLMGKIQDGSEGPNWTLDDGLIRYKGQERNQRRNGCKEPEIPGRSARIRLGQQRNQRRHGCKEPKIPGRPARIRLGHPNARKPRKSEKMAKTSS
nr:uncharacterized protein LOC109178468 [Ipomoea batatas]